MSLKTEQIQLQIVMKADTARQEIIKLEGEAKILQKELVKVKKKFKDTSDEYKQAAEKLNAVNLKISDYRNEIGLTGMTMADLQKQAKQLRIQLSNLDPRKEEFKEYRKELDAVNGRMKELRGGARKTELSLMSITKTNFSKLVGPYLGITALISFFRTLTSTILDFSKATSELKALTGATGKDLDFLKRSAKELGAQYGKSATDIVTAMKLVGGAKPELLQNVEALSMMTESAIILSKATGMSMEDTTNNLTTIMNQFGLSAADGDRVINTLAAGSKFGAKEVDYLGDSISKVGVTMKSAGLSLETGVAIMEMFGEKGVKAETAGNGFKRVLVELQKDTANYTNGVFDLNKAIDNNQNIAGDNIALQKKFGTEFFGLAQILFQNKERFKELNQQVSGTTTAMEQYLDATDNLSGDIDKLNAGWKSFILSLEDGQGPIANASRWLTQLFTQAVEGARFLTKSSAQNEKDYIATNTNQRLESFKKTLNEIEGVDKKIKEINASIIAERGVYKKYDERIAFLKEEIRWRKNLGGAWDDNNKKMQKEIDSLAKLRTRSVSYVNALAGLRSTLNPATVVDDDTTTTTTTTNTTTKSKEDIANERERKALAAIDAWKKKEELLIKEKYSLGQLSKEKYESELLRIEKESLTKKRDLYKKDTKDYIDYQTNLTDIAIAERLKSNEAELKVLETANTARVKAIDVYAQTRKEELEQLFADELITEKEYKEKSLIIDIETANAKLQNAKDYFVLISDAKYNSEEEKQRAILSAQNAVDAANKAILDAQKAANKNKLDEEKKHLEYVKRLRNELGLDKEKLNYKEGLDALKKKLKEAEASEKESTDAINAYKIGKAQEYAQTTNDIAGSVADAISAYHEYEVASLDAAKQKELKSAGDNASKREAIEKDYAQKELDLKKKQSSTDTVIKSLQAVAAGALGIANVWAVHAANPILAGILTALVAATTGIQVGTIVKQNQAIQAMTLDTSTGGSPATPEPKGTLVAQAADGRYDVVGAQDNQLYRNVPYGGNARTGLVTTPTLYGERGTELVIDAPTLSRLNMKVPNFNSFVLANRVNQRADGNYAPAQSGAASAGSNTVMLTMIATLQKNNELLDYLKTHGVEAFMLYDKAQQQQRIYEESIKKGSK